MNYKVECVTIRRTVMELRIEFCCCVVLSMRF